MNRELSSEEILQTLMTLERERIRMEQENRELKEQMSKAPQAPVDNREVVDIKAHQEAISIREKRIGELVKEIDQLNHTVENLQAEVSANEEAKAAASEVDSDKDKEIDSLKRDIEVLHHEKDIMAQKQQEMEAKQSSLEKEKETFVQEKKSFAQEKESLLHSKKALEQERDTLKNRNNALNTEVSRNSIAIKELREKYEAELQEVKQRWSGNADDSLINALKQEISELKQKMESGEAAKELALLKQKHEELNQANEKMRAEAERLKHLAYFDTKTEVKNNNALNETIKAMDIKNTVFGFISINGLKKINDKFGRQTGDECIRTVVNYLLKHFDNEHVYRVIGDQFAVVYNSQENDYNSLYSTFSEIQKELESIDLHTTFGVGDGYKYASVEQMITEVEAQMRSLKGTTQNQSVNEWTQEKPAAAPEVKEEKARALSDDELFADMLMNGDNN